MKKRPNSPLPEYSYSQSLKKEEVRVYRRMALILTFSIAIIVILWFAGTAFINALSLLSKGNQDNSQATTSASLPLLVPKINKLPSATNNNEISISGETTSEVEVTLFVNDREIGKVKAETDGSFVFNNVNLTNGLNLIRVVASDSSGKTEESSVTITLDKIKPPLAINSPIDGTKLPKETKTVNVSGTTETEAIVYVNGSQAIVDSTGKFSFNLPLIEGENIIEVSSTDSASNSNRIKITVTVES